jgi:hypothetical protein
MMKRIGKSKLLSTIIALSLILTTVVLISRPVLAAAESDVSRTTDLTYGDTIWVNVSGLTKDNEYEVYIEDDAKTSGWWETGVSSDTADSFGKISMSVEVPFRNPLGDYKLSVWDVTTTAAIVAATNTTITIANTYNVKFYVGGEEVSYLLHNETYDSDATATTLTIKAYNGSSLINDWDINIAIYDPEAALFDSQTDIGNGAWTPTYTIFDYTGDLPNREVCYYVNVTPSDASGSRSGEWTNITLPVKLDVTVTVPTDATYGDEDQVVTIYVKDRDGSDEDSTPTGVLGYDVSLYSPCATDGTYVKVKSATTSANGKATLTFDTADGSAGKWYVGTEEAGTYRIDETYSLDIANFIVYGSFTVGTKTDGTLAINSPDEIVSGFDIDMNVSVYEPNYDTDPTYYDEMEFYFTGLDAYYDGVEYSSSDIISVDSALDGYSSNSKYAYYELDTIVFNATGTGTIIATWPYNYTVYTDFDLPDLAANISTSKTFTVTSAAEMTMVVDDMVDEVMVDDLSCGWQNHSTTITINLYADTQDEMMNASIDITGCGIDISIAEDDAIDDGYWVSEGVYSVPISPKTAGTLTITATNDTGDKSISKDYTIKGLSGSVTTSVGDDLEISVQTDETITLTISESYADVRLAYFDENWVELVDCLNDTIGENEAGNGLGGVYEFDILADDIDQGIGYIVVAANAGTFYMYDIVEVVPIPDLVLTVTVPNDATNKSLTVGLEHEYQVKVYDADGNNIGDEIDTVVGKIIDENHDEDSPLQTVSFSWRSGTSSWRILDWEPYYAGTFIITATNDTGINEHTGNISLDVDLATITYSPDTATVGIEQEDLEIEVTGVDANGEALPEGTIIYLNVENDFSLDLSDTDVTLDEDGAGTFTITSVGDNETWINATLLELYDASKNGNKTNGQITVDFPTFTVDPSTIYIGMANEITITAKDNEGVALDGINITLLGSSAGVVASQPEPAMTDENGMVILEVEPQASGKLNVTIARNVRYVGGVLDWDNAVVTDTYVTVTSLKTMTIEVSKSPIYEGETLMVTIRSGVTLVSDAYVTFAGETKPTGSDGTVTFVVSDPGNVDYGIYKVKAQKTGYITPASEDVTVLKKWTITISGPSTQPAIDEKFTVTVTARGSGLAGATVTFEGQTATSDNDGKATFTAPKTKGTYTVTATYESYETGSASITIKEKGGIPGFELVTLIAAIGVALILLRRKRN